MVAVGHRKHGVDDRPAYLANPLIAQIGPLVLHAEAQRRAADLRRCPTCDLLAASGERTCRHCGTAVSVTGTRPDRAPAGPALRWLSVAGVVAVALVLSAFLVGAVAV